MNAHRILCVVAALTIGPIGSAWPQENAGPLRTVSLAEALELAGKTSEQVGIAAAAVERTRGQHLQVRSGYFPQLSASATYVRTLESQFSGFRGEGDGGAPIECTRFRANPGLSTAERLDSLEQALVCIQDESPFGDIANLPFGQPNQYSLGVSLSQNIFNPRLGGEVRAASAARAGAEVQLTAQRAQLVLDVTRAYYDALLADRLTAIAESTLSQAERTFRETGLARRVGTQPEFELLRAQVTRDNQRPVVIQRRRARDLAYVRLTQLLDLPVENQIELTSELGDTSEVPIPQYATSAVHAPSDTSSAVRAPVRQAAENVRAQEGFLASARNERLPSLTLSSQYSRIAFPSSVSPFSSRYIPDWTVSLRLELPLFNGGRLTGDRVVAEANLDEARLQLARTRELAVEDTRNATATIAAAQATWAASAGTVGQANRAYEIAEIRFREGISTQTELADSRLLLQQAEAIRAQAARDLQVARVRLALLPNLPLEAGAGFAPGGAGGLPFSPPADPSPQRTPVPVPAGGGTVVSAATGSR